ncbi:MAG: hypothetical protein AAFN77_24550 [Planctomycetota bacterium]
MRSNRVYLKTIGGIGFALAILSALGIFATRSTGRPESQLDVKHTYAVKKGTLRVTVVEQGGLESSENIEIKCKVRGRNTVNWVIENGTQVQPGDVLVRLDTLAIEDAINERSKYAFQSRASAENSQAILANAKLAIKEYTEGRYQVQMMTLEKNLKISQASLLLAKNQYEHTEKLSVRGFAHDREMDQRRLAVNQATLDVDARKNDIDVLEKYTRPMKLKTLEGDLASAQARHDANEERAVLDEKRASIAREEFKHCVIKAERSGLIIFPSAAAWKSAPDVTEGATVHKDQVLLLMPNLDKMQVKIGIHESIVKQIRPGMKCIISIPDGKLEGEVLAVASVARPAGWWTGNMVKYDTIVSLPENYPGLKPGMSAEVEIVIAELDDVIRVPVAAVLQTASETLVWVKTDGGVQRRVIQIGESNDVFIAVRDGLGAGDEVVIDPAAFIPEAKQEALKTLEEAQEKLPGDPDRTE